MKRPIKVYGDKAYVPLTQGYEATIDASDLAVVVRWNWTAFVQKRKDGSVRNVYAVRYVTKSGHKRPLLMHRALVDDCGTLQVDHKDGNGLRNTRDNLRTASFSQNQMNARKRGTSWSKFKGVTFEKRRQLWISRICRDGIVTRLGQFNCQTAAALAYAKASRELHGEFGRVA